MTIEIIDRLKESGDLDYLLRAGLLSPTVLVWRKIYHTYQSRLEAGEKKMKAMQQTCETWDVSKSTCYRALNAMKYEPSAKS